MESENTLVFVVEKSATKAEVKTAIETLLGCHVKAVREARSWTVDRIDARREDLGDIQQTSARWQLRRDSVGAVP